MQHSTDRLIHDVYVIKCVDGQVAMSKRTLLALIKNGFVFEYLIIGGGGFKEVTPECHIDLSAYNTTQKAINRLIMAIVHGRVTYYEDLADTAKALGGFRAIDNHIRRQHAYNPMTPSEDKRHQFDWLIANLYPPPVGFSATILVPNIIPQTVAYYRRWKV